MVNLKPSSIDKPPFNLGGNQRITTAGSKRTGGPNGYLVDDVSYVLNIFYQIANIGFSAIGGRLARKQYIPVIACNVDVNITTISFTNTMAAFQLDSFILNKYAACSPIVRHRDTGSDARYNTHREQGATGKKRNK
jgi:hypothetical protein